MKLNHMAIAAALSLSFGLPAWAAPDQDTPAPPPSAVMPSQTPSQSSSPATPPQTIGEESNTSPQEQSGPAESVANPELISDEGEASEPDEEAENNVAPEPAIRIIKDADLFLGHGYYKNGLIAESLPYLHNAAKKGLAEAQYLYGMCLLEHPELIQREQSFFEAFLNIDTAQPDTLLEAFTWITRSADQNYPDALFMLSQFRLKGWGCNADERESEQLLRRAANLGQSDAIRELDKRQNDRQIWEDMFASYEEGRYKHLYRDALHFAFGDFPEAQYFLGFCYYNGAGIAKNPVLAHYFLEKACKDIPEAKYYYALCLINGIGGNKNLKKAINLLREASQDGILDADNYLGLCFLDGQGVKKNEKSAFNYFKKAADKGLREAQVNLAQCYINGWGTEKDEVAGQKLMELSNGPAAPSEASLPGNAVSESPQATDQEQAPEAETPPKN